MTPGPEPGSAWERCCPDALPQEKMHLTAGMVPPGKHYATQAEADLIAGRITEAEFLATAPSPSLSPGKTGHRERGKGHSRKPNRVVVKFRERDAFYATLVDRTPPLSPGAVMVWDWLHHCERNGIAWASHAKLATRFQVSASSVKRYLKELTTTDLLHVDRRGKLGAGSSTYRVSPPPPKPKN